MLNRGQLIEALVDRGAGDRKHVGNVLKHLAEVAEDEIGEGNDFVIPGVVRIDWQYRDPQKRGERWKKGDEVTGFGGIASVKDADSPAVAARVKLRAVPTGAVARLKPGSKPEVQKEFLKGKVGRAIARRKTRKGK